MQITRDTQNHPAIYPNHPVISKGKHITVPCSLFLVSFSRHATGLRPPGDRRQPGRGRGRKIMSVPLRLKIRKTPTRATQNAWPASRLASLVWFFYVVTPLATENRKFSKKAKKINPKQTKNTKQKKGNAWYHNTYTSSSQKDKITKKRHKDNEQKTKDNTTRKRQERQDIDKTSKTDEKQKKTKKNGRKSRERKKKQKNVTKTRLVRFFWPWLRSRWRRHPPLRCAMR